MVAVVKLEFTALCTIGAFCSGPVTLCRIIESTRFCSSPLLYIYVVLVEVTPFPAQ